MKLSRYARGQEQLVLFGGTAATRQQVIDYLLSCRGRNGEQMNFLCAEHLAWMLPMLTKRRAAKLPPAKQLLEHLEQVA